MTAPQTADIDKPYRGRRLTWREFYALRPDLKADNDNAALPKPRTSSNLPAKRICWWKVTDMKFEPELLRELLLHIEREAVYEHDQIEQVEIDGWRSTQIAYHIKLAMQDGLIDCEILLDPMDEDGRTLAYTIHGITADGHRLIETIRDPAHWRIVKDGAAKVGNLGLTTLVAFAGAWVRLQIKEKTGLDV